MRSLESVKTSINQELMNEIYFKKVLKNKKKGNLANKLNNLKTEGNEFSNDTFNNFKSLRKIMKNQVVVLDYDRIYKKIQEVSTINNEKLFDYSDEIRRMETENKRFVGVEDELLEKYLLVVKEIKQKLDTFIDYTLKQKNILSYNYTFYHYPIYYYNNTLHIHIYRKKTGFDEISRIYSTGNGSNFYHQYTKYIANEYNKLNVSVWPNYHYSIVRILCTNNLITFMNETIDIFILFNKSEYTNDDIYNMATFLFELMKRNLILTYIVPNNENVTDCIKKYYINLIKYKDNMKKIVQDLYYLYNSK